jgi:serine/threonine-protein kinase
MVATASILQTPETLLETEECAPGALLGGKYRLHRLLGEGGMANVWLARNELLDLPVALKIVRPQIRGSETAARLLTEARVQANLRHPNVARVYDYGQTSSGDAFIVMELLEGYSLAEWLERDGALSPVLAVQIMLPVIDALCAAHRAGVVHRDLKPDNVFISHPSSDLCPKLLDFGIAKLNTDFNPRLTGQGGVVGSPAYMAPEQARGLNDVDERVDVWAACVVLYEAITGKPAFDGSNHLALMLAVIEEELEPLVSPDCEDLWPILAAGLVKEREERTASMLTLGAQLAKWLAARGATQDLGGEPVHWRYAFSASDVDAAAPRARTRLIAANSNRAGAREDSRRVSANRRGSGDRRAPADRHSRTPWAAVRKGLRTMSLSPSAVRKAAAVRLALAACVGGGLLVLGMSQGPLSWLAPKPESAFALAEGGKSEPYIAQPATPAQLAQMNRAEALPARDSELPKRAPVVDASQLAAATESEATAPANPVLTQTVRAQPDFTQSARYAQAASARRHEAAAERLNRETAEQDAAAPAARAQVELASFMDLKAAPAAKAHSAQPAAASRPVVNVLTVSPRSKSAASQPSEAELGLKNPW